MEFGHLVVFRKGSTSAPYELDEKEHSIGSSMDSHIRLKFSNPLLMETHALIRVNENGIATIINKSIGAPVKVNGKTALKPTILKHEDKFEILDKVFQYYNENLKNESEDSEKFVKEKRNILANNRKSVDPLVKTPAKKSPILKTKIPSIRKSTSAVSRPTKGLQVIITPHKKPDTLAGSKTASKIIVSKALVSPRSAKKRRLSLGNSNKASQSPKISSRNILLSKSTINITISEEHEYSEVRPSTSMRTIQENEIVQEDVVKTKGRTPKRSVKVERGDTSNKDISVSLIDFNSPDTPAINSPLKGRGSSIRKTPLRQPVFKTETKDSTPIASSPNVMKTPINKRIQSLKTVRHSLKKDTPPPRFNLPKVVIQPPTPQTKRLIDMSLNEQSDISISYSPNAEPSTRNLSEKDRQTPRRSGIKKFEENSPSANKSRVSFAIEAPTEASPIMFEAINEYSQGTDTDSGVCTSEDPRGPRKLEGSRRNDEVGTPEARRSKSKQSLTTEELEPDLEVPKGRRSSRYSLNSTKKLEDGASEQPLEESPQKASRDSRGNRWSKTEGPLLRESPDLDREDLDINSKRKSLRNIVISASTEGSDTERQSFGRKSSISEKSPLEQHRSFSKSLSKSPGYSGNTSKASPRGHKVSVLSEDEKLAEPLEVSTRDEEDSSAEEMDELQIDSSVSPSSFKSCSRTSARFEKSNKKVDDTTARERSIRISQNKSKISTGLDLSTDFSVSVDDASDIDEDIPKTAEKSLNISKNVSRRSTKLDKSAGFSVSENDSLKTRPSTNINKSSSFSQNVSRSTNLEEPSSSSLTDDDLPDSEDIVNGLATKSSRRSTKIEALPSSSETEDNTTNAEDNVNRSSRVSRNVSRRSTKIEGPTDSSRTEENATNGEDYVNKSSRASRNAFRRNTRIEQAADSSETGANAVDVEDHKSSRVSRNVSRRSTEVEASADFPETEDNATDAEDYVNKSSRVSRNVSRRSTKIEGPTDSSQTEENAADGEDYVNKSSRVSRNDSRRSRKIEHAADSFETGATAVDTEDHKSSRISRNVSRRSTNVKVSTDFSETEDNATDVEDFVNKSSRISRNVSRRSTKVETFTDSSQTEANATDAEGYDNNSSRTSGNVSRRSTKVEASADSSQTEDNATDAEGVVNKSSRLSRNVSRRSTKVEASADSSQTEDNATDAEDYANKSSRISRNVSRRSTKVGTSADCSQTEDNATDAEGDVNKSSRLSRNVSRRSTKVEASADSSQTEDNATDAEDYANKSSRTSRNVSRRSTKVETSADSSQTEDNVTDPEGYINKSSRISRNVSRRSTKVEASADSSQTEDNATDAEDFANKSSRISRNVSRRSTKVETSADSSQTEDNATDAEDYANKSSRISRNVSRRSAKVAASADSSQTEDNGTDAEGYVNKSSRISRNLSRRSTKVKASGDSSQTEDNATDAEDYVNKSSRISRNVSRRSTKIETPDDSAETEDTATDVEENIHTLKIMKISSRRSWKNAGSFQIENDNKYTEDNVDTSARLSRNLSRRSGNLEQLSSSSLTEDDSTNTEESSRLSKNISQSSNVSLRNSSKSSAKARNSQSSIDSAETTVDVRQKYDREATKDPKNKQSLSLFDETTQEAKPVANTSKKRASIFDESTREVFPEFNKSLSVKPISILDDTQEVLSPVRPLSRKSIRKTQNQDVENSISSSKRGNRRSLQDSSLTATSMDQSSSSVISISSRSFSSFKKASSRKDETGDESEIDVVSISSTIDITEKNSFKGNVKDEVLEESNASRSSKRQSRTSEMFKDVSCTSTPFHKQNLSKKSQESETSGSTNVTQNRRGSSSAVSRHPEATSISSSGSDSVFLSSSAEKGTDVDVPAAARRRSSRTGSVSRQGGEHNCVSCRNSSVKRSRSLSVTSEPPNVEGRNVSSSSKPSKTPRKSGSVLERSYEETSPVKRISSVASNKLTPLLHRKSLGTLASEKTPEKAAEIEDETPKSSIKPSRRSSKANQSAYNPLLEDITPVTPEKLMVSGFTEDVFKTPINTPGLFENIRKSAIRSRKRHRESSGSAMKDSKRARVDFAQEENPETSTEVEHLQQKPQKSPVNRLSNFEGVKKLMGTPPKSPKNDLRNVPNLRKLVSPKAQASPKNDLTNVAGVKRMFNTPKDARSPKNDLTNVPNLRRLVSPKRQNTPKNDLTQIPNLRRIMSPKQQNSPKNDLSSPVGVKRLLKTPRVQKEPVDDLGNVTGVASIFNVSGVEVLHQGSDIENSEDLFTKLTGKRPVRAYPRGKSLSPCKEDPQEQTHSRKTMGDIPVCSPRVQQWVEDHANVMYASVEDVPGKRKSRIGRSVSPKKPGQDAKNRRKTQGDLRGDSPNVAAWKQEQAKLPKSLTVTSGVKTEILSPTPIQTLQGVSTKAEKVTPRRRSTKAEILTPQPQQQMTQPADAATPASLRARRGDPRLLAEDGEEPPVHQNQTITSSGKNKAPKCDSQDDLQPKVSEKPKEIVNRPLQAVKSGGRGKRILSTEEMDIVNSTTGSPVPEPLSKKTRSRRGGAKTEVSPSVDQKGGDTPDIFTKTRKGKTDPQSDLEIKVASIPRNRRGQKQSESEVEESEPKKAARGRPRKNKVDEIQATPEVSASPIRRGGRRGKNVEVDTPIDNKQVDDNEDQISDTGKPTSRSRRGRNIDSDSVSVEEAPLKKSAPKGRVVKKDAEEQQELDNMEKAKVQALKKTISKGKRGQKIDEGKEDILQADVVAESQVDSKKTASGRRGRKVDILESTESKDMPEQIVDVDVKKPAPKGRKAKPQVTDIAQNEPEVKKPSRARRGKNTEDEVLTETQSANVIDEIEEAEDKKLPRGRRGKKVAEEKESQPKTDAVKPTKGLKTQEEDTGETLIDEIEEPEVKKSSRGRRGKKVAEGKESQPKTEAVKPAKGLKTQEEDTGETVIDEIEEPEVKKTSRARRGKKVGEEKESQPKTEAVKPAKGLKTQEEDTGETTDTEVEFKKPTRGRSKKGDSQASSAETEAVRRGALPSKDEAEVTPSSPAPKATRSRRGAKVVEEQTEIVEVAEKVPAKRGRGRKIDVDEPESEQEETESSKKAPRGKGKKGASTKKDESTKAEETPEIELPKKTSTRGRGKKETTEDQPAQNTKKPRNKIIEEVKELDVDSPRTARAKRGVNKKYSTDEYEVVEIQSGSKRKVRFEDDSVDKDTPEVNTRKSKRTRK